MKASTSLCAFICFVTSSYVLVVASEGVGGDFNSILELVKPYPLEKHYVTTKDGYILSLYRIPHGLKTTGTHTGTHFSGQLITAAAGRKVLRPEATDSGGSASASDDGDVGEETSRKPVVLLQHGLLDSCAGFLLAGHDSALAFLLVEAGFDVWLGNSRGSTYSRAHVTYPITSREFWTFSFDEMAAFDLPATLSYIRSHTGVHRLHYVGHSQGNTLLLAALSPTMADKISFVQASEGAAEGTHTAEPFSAESQALSRSVADSLGLVVMLAPVATAKFVTSVPLQAMAAVGTDALFALMGIHEFLPSLEVASWLYGGLCTVRPELCVSILAAICGYRKHAVNETRLPLYLRYTPAGSSVHNMAHWAQAVRGGKNPAHPKFSMFDYGKDCGLWATQGTCNQRKYGALDPPTYKLGSIPSSVRLALFTVSPVPCFTLPAT